MGVQFFHRDDSGVHLVSVDGLLMAALHRPLRQEDLPLLANAYRQACTNRVWPYLHLIEPLGELNYDTKVTKQYLTVLDNYWNAMSLIGVALLSDHGIMGSVVRSMATGFLLRRARKPVKVHNTVQDTLKWMKEQDEVRIETTLTEIESFLSQTRKAFHAYESQS